LVLIGVILSNSNQIWPLIYSFAVLTTLKINGLQMGRWQEHQDQSTMSRIGRNRGLPKLKMFWARDNHEADTISNLLIFSQSDSFKSLEFFGSIIQSDRCVQAMTDFLAVCGASLLKAAFEVTRSVAAEELSRLSFASNNQLTTFNMLFPLPYPGWQSTLDPKLDQYLRSFLTIIVSITSPEMTSIFLALSIEHLHELGAQSPLWTQLDGMLSDVVKFPKLKQVRLTVGDLEDQFRKTRPDAIAKVHIPGLSMRGIISYE